MLPVSAPPPSSQQSSLDKTSVIRITVADLKCRDVINRGALEDDPKNSIFKTFFRTGEPNCEG